VAHSDRRDQETGSMPLCVKDESAPKRPIKSDTRLRLGFRDLVDFLLTAVVWVAIP
jgi:hypothetical protein